jgi:hypothetical protein
MRWRADGRELFYIALDRSLMAVPIRDEGDGDGLVVGRPVPLFTTRVGDVVPPQSGYYLSYAVSPDGSRFLMRTVAEETRAAPITVILNWQPK